MSTFTGFAVTGNGDGDFYPGFESDLNDQVMHHHHHLQQQQHQQQRQQMELRANNHRNELQAMAVTVTDVQNRFGYGYHNSALTIPPALSCSSLPDPSRPVTFVSNLNSFLNSVTPIVAAQKLPEASLNGAGNQPYYYCIGDLWESFQEWSAYGAGVPFLLNGIHPTTQYYVPFLSGMQLYIDPTKPRMRNGSRAEENAVAFHGPNQQTYLGLDASFASLNLNDQRQKQLLLSDNKTVACGSRGMLAFEFMEQDRPHKRKPLSAKASVLESHFPELRNYRSCDLLPSSWIAVAWYPIYRIPTGPTLEDLEASFLTLHALSTQPGSYNEAMSSNRNPHEDRSEIDLLEDDAKLDLSAMVRLPVIGLVSYKLNGSIISPCNPQEREQENALLNAASNWLTDLQAILPDYQFFRNRY